MILSEKRNHQQKEILLLQKLEKMCDQKYFDRNKAVHLIRQVNVNREFPSVDHPWYTTVLLANAEKASNLPMTELLLHNGADPNVLCGEYKSSPFCSLQFEGVMEHQDDEERLKMAQLFLEYGADPQIDPNRSGGSLFDYVTYSVFNETTEDYDEDYLVYHSRFLILLVAYGASSDYCTPCVTGVFDKTDMSQYAFDLLWKGNAICCGVIVDRDKNIVAQLPAPTVDFWEYREAQRSKG